MLNQLTLKRRSAVDLERAIKVVRFFLASVFEILLKVPMNGEKGRLGQIVIFLKLVANVFDESRPGRVLDDVLQPFAFDWRTSGHERNQELFLRFHKVYIRIEPQGTFCISI